MASFAPGDPVTTVVERIEIHKLRQGENLILGFSIGGGIDQDSAQNPYSLDKKDKGVYVTRVSQGGPAQAAGLREGDKIMQVNGWDLTWVTMRVDVVGDVVGDDAGSFGGWWWWVTMRVDVVVVAVGDDAG
ncbi:tax1-binding protein 3-like [Lampetra planeri]